MLLISSLWVFQSSFIPQFLLLARAALLLLDTSLFSGGRHAACIGKWLCLPSFWFFIVTTVHVMVSCTQSCFELFLEWFCGQLSVLPVPVLSTGVAGVAHNHSLAAKVPLPSTSGHAAFVHCSLCKHACTPKWLYTISSNCPFSREVNQIHYICVMTAVSAWMFCLWQKIDKPSFSIEIACYDYISFPCSQNQYVHIMIACYLMLLVPLRATAQRIIK